MRLWLPFVASAFCACATVNGAMELTDLNFADRTSTREETRPSARWRARVELAAADPWRLSCSVERAAPAVHVTDETWTWRPWRRALIGLAGAAEGAVAAYALTQGLDGDARSTASLALGAGLGVDAAASLLAAVFLREAHATTEHERTGGWLASDRCPAGTALELGGARSPVAANGSLRPEDERALVDALLAGGGPLRVHVGGRVEEVFPTSEQRCAWDAARSTRAARVQCASGERSWRLRVELSGEGALEP